MKRIIRNELREIKFTPLWKMLKVRNISVLRFAIFARLTPIELYLLKTDGNIRLSTITKVTRHLKCTVGDILTETVTKIEQ